MNQMDVPVRFVVLLSLTPPLFGCVGVMFERGFVCIYLNLRREVTLDAQFE